MAREIRLNKGYVTIVDDEDFDWLSVVSWSAYMAHTGSVYAQASFTRLQPDGTRRVTGCREMQRVILDPDGVMPRSLKADHKDGDTLNNQRSNLRLVTDSISNINRRMPKSNASGFRGVHWSTDKQRWRAGLKLNGKVHWGGLFDTALEAGRAYNALAILHYGTDAQLNDVGDA